MRDEVPSYRYGDHLVTGFTVTLIVLIGAPAVAGAVGAGSLGNAAIRYG